MHRSFRRFEGETAIDIEHDGTPTSSADRDMITINFGTGEVTGIFVQDHVCLGNTPSVSEKMAVPVFSLNF